MSEYQVGLACGIFVAIAWTGSSLAFAAAGRSVGSVPVNLIRLVIAFLMLTALCTVRRGLPLPTDATQHQLIWLGLSGVIGFFIGDLGLFRSYILIGARRATLIMALAPAFATVAGFLAFGERLGPRELFGITVTLFGVMWVVIERAPRADGNGFHHVSRKGIVLGMLGSMGQGFGAVMTKHAYLHGRFDPFASTQVRALAAIPLFIAFIMITRRSAQTLRALRHSRAIAYMTMGAFAGPFLGVSMFNAAVERIPSGVAATLAGMVPIFMLPVARFLQKEHISLRAAAGAVIAVAGVAVLVLH